LLTVSDIISIGVKGLLLRKARSLLSTLGIVFGVAAVSSMLSVGEGARVAAIEQIRLLGTNNIRIKHIELTGEKRTEAARRSSPGLTYRDAALIQNSVPDRLTVTPLKFVAADVRYQGRQGVATVVGTDPDYGDVTNFRVAEGRFIGEFDLSNFRSVCVLGADIAQELFGYGAAIDNTIRLGDAQCTVVGVMEAKEIREGRAAVIKVRDLNRDVYIPVTSAQRRFTWARDPSAIDEIAVRVHRADDLYWIVDLIKNVLGRQHRGVEDYDVVIPEELLAQAQRTQRLFNIVVGSVAAISLLVGGIGIMNIMLANVSERTREIGIRRAIGATKGAILAQFLVETVLICLTGGAMGILLGFGLAHLIALYARWETAFSFGSVLIAFGTAALVGLVFGLFPARRAAQLDPVQALRAE